MSGGDQREGRSRAREITAALVGRRFGLCGYDVSEAQKISRFLFQTKSLAVPLDERTFAESTGFCDAVLLKLSSASPERLRAAATVLAVPVLVTGSGPAILEGSGTAYLWPHDFMCEPWTEAELLVRLFRLLESPGRRPSDPVAETRTEPLVLLADDDPELVALVEVTLWKDGITCRTVSDGLSALRLAREVGPDLILLDVRMPAMDGFEVLETLRRDPGLQMLPVILLTGCDDPADVMRGAELQADEYLGKPVGPLRLLSRVNRLLSGHVRDARRWSRASTGNLRPGETARPWMLSSGPRPAAEEKP